MRHTYTYANNSDDGHQASARAVRVVQLFPWLTAELIGCVCYYQHLTVVAVALVRTFLVVIDVCRLSNEINAALK